MRHGPFGAPLARACRDGVTAMDEQLDNESALEAAARVAGAPLSVTRLNALARRALERTLPLLWVAGEISNYTRAPSGHCYFTLKDERAQVRCIMFRTRALLLEWSPANGAQVEVRAIPSLYEARGEFQLTVDFMRRAGLGVLFERFARLKTRLEAEGLFAAQRKRLLPRFPARIGLITSPAGAALRDVLTTLRRRMPRIPIVLYPTPVQGEGAAAQIAAMLATAGRRMECDVLILCRGGGSIEDLWAFNEEAVARAIAACPVPVICGVGHETDFTIADFVADARAPTPTGAAGLASPDRFELAGQVRVASSRLQRGLQRTLERRMQQTDLLARRLVHPGERIARRFAELAHLRSRLTSAHARTQERARSALARVAQRLATARPDTSSLFAQQLRLRERLRRALAQGMHRRAATVERLEAHLKHLDPRQVLERGYAIVTDDQGRIVRSHLQLEVGSNVQMALADGAARARVTGTSS
jgi:exodeoxyribonuclease VII large subunit